MVIIGPLKVMFVSPQVLEIEVEAGAPDGQQVRVRGEGEPHMDGDPGDLVVILQTSPHTVFTRRGDDLYTNVTLSLQVSKYNLVLLVFQWKTLQGKGCPNS